MKRIYCIFCLTLYSLLAESQVNAMWPDSNAVWVDTYYELVFQQGSPIPTEVLKGVDNYCMGTEDTIFGGLNYSKIYHCGISYKGALRADGGQVYFLPEDSIKEFLLYDFDVSTGDSIQDVYMEDAWGFSAALFDLKVINIDSVLIGGTYRKRIDLSGSSGYAYWIEGVGNTQGLFRDIFPNISNFVIKLECMSINESSVYPVDSAIPCDLPALTPPSQPVEVFATVKDTNGNPIPGYAVYLGEGNNSSVNKIGSMMTDNQGVAHDSVLPGSFQNLYAYVYDCNLDKVVEYEIAVPKTATDSTHFEFVLGCPADSCEIALFYERVDADSNQYHFGYERAGNGIWVITPLWTFSDGTMSHDPLVSPKTVPPGWFEYCIDLGCAPTHQTCDSFYVEPDCEAHFYLDTVNSIIFNGNIIFWKEPVIGTEYSYHWDFGDGGTASSAYPVHTYSQAGTYTICLEVSYNDGTMSCSDTFCNSFSFNSEHLTLQVMDPGEMGFQEYELSNLRLYPNPATESVLLSWDEAGAPLEYELYDMNGKIMLRGRLENGIFRRIINLDGVDKGVYLLKVNGKRETKVFKLLIN